MCNLFGLPGRAAGTYPDFKYGDSIVAAGAAGLVWDKESFEAYVADPNAFLKEKTGDKAAVQTASGNMGRACGGCHDAFRAK